MNQKHFIWCETECNEAKKKEKMGIIDLVKLKRLHEISMADESQKKYAEKFNDDPLWCKLNS